MSHAKTMPSVLRSANGPLRGFGRCHTGLLFVLCIPTFLVPLSSKAQAPPANQRIPWSPYLKPVVLGDGIAVAPNRISVLGAGVERTNYLWQNKTTTLSLLDYANISNTISKLRLNAWAEYDGFASSGSFSFDYNNYHAFNGNQRTWEIDAVRSWTALLPSPHLTAEAISYQGNPVQFAGLYGNYAVTGITYRREIKILFQQSFTTSVSSQQWNAAIQGSYGAFSGGLSVGQEQANLNAIGQTQITISVVGPGGGIIAAGSSGDLPSLQAAVKDQLATWDTAPSDPNDAGAVDSVYLTTYNAVTPVTSIATQFSPNQIVMAGALAKLTQLLQAQQRLSDIGNTDTDLNPKLYAYLFGKTDAFGNYVPGKYDEVQADVTKQLAYYKSLHDQDGLVADPKINFSFQDPDVIRWRVLNAIEGPHPGDTYNPGTLLVEIYSNVAVDPVNLTATDSIRWGTRWFSSTKKATTSAGISEIVQAGVELSEQASYAGHLDSVTGIPHRYAYLEWEDPPAPADILLGLIQNGLQTFTAVDWNGTPAPQLFVPATSFHLP